ncbi:MAG TPA: hypothetical protein VG889_14770 [Rhizomicrobium sp.]|nr:hypothetical protein [Rhizomicrobium sp.]
MLLTAAPHRAVARPVCAIKNGQVLKDNAHWSAPANTIEIHNESNDDVIVKIRSGADGTLLIAFFVARRTSVGYPALPDGTYRVQFAYGRALDRRCTGFAQLSRAAEFPDAETLETNLFGFPGTLAYTLQSRIRGNVEPLPIDAASFDAP